MSKVFPKSMRNKWSGNLNCARWPEGRKPASLRILTITAFFHSLGKIPNSKNLRISRSNKEPYHWQEVGLHRMSYDSKLIIVNKEVTVNVTYRNIARTFVMWYMVSSGSDSLTNPMVEFLLPQHTLSYISFSLWRNTKAKSSYNRIMNPFVADVSTPIVLKLRSQ